MTTQILRAYTGKDAEMLLAADVILNAAIEHAATIQEQRPLWNAAYYTALKTRVADAATSILGANTIAGLRDATSRLRRIEATALKDLAFLKVQIEEDFRKDHERRDTLLNALGFDARYKAARTSGDQEAIGAVLARVSTGLTPDIAQELTGKGISPALLSELTQAAVDIRAADVYQEGVKGSRPQATRQSIATLNDLYEDVIGVAKIAARIFSDDKATKARFSYARTIKAMNSYTGTEDKKEKQL